MSWRTYAFVMLLAMMQMETGWTDTPIGWRGDGSGIFATDRAPTQWSTTKNVAWKTRLPAPSKGSPIVVGDSVFMQAYPHTLICVRRSDGKLLWQKTHEYAQAVPGTEGVYLDEQYPTDSGDLQEMYWNDLSQTTPTSDGKLVYSVFGNGVISAHAIDGKRKWIRFIERPRVKYSAAASPRLVSGHLIVHLNDLVALDPKNGDEVWRTKLPATHATSVVARIGETDVLVHPSGTLVLARTGEILASDLFDADIASPLIVGDSVFVHGETLFSAIRLPKSVGATPSQLWKEKATYGGYTIASPVVHGRRIYGVNKNGILEVVDAESGKIVHRKRLPLGGKVYSGITLTGGLLYVGNEKGTHLVIRADDRCEEVARNDLGEQIYAAPVFFADQLFLRGERHLFCIGN